MRAMTESEIDKLVLESKWATIITVSPDGSPYAIEATPFELDGDVCFMINPNGTTKKNVDHSERVLLKYTMTDKELRGWAKIIFTLIKRHDMMSLINFGGLSWILIRLTTRSTICGLI
jgi:hypothetical protein